MGSLQLQGLRKSFGKTEVIKGVDLQVRDGEFVVFVGPSGCGKSTLLRMIAGLEDVTTGAVLLDGEDVTAVAPARRGMAMVFQTYALYPHLSVRDNMGLGLRQAGVPRAEIARDVDRASAMLALDPYLDRRPAELSGGQRQRVAIGRAIVRTPKLFLFDEPLSNLDAALRVATRIEIARLHRELGATMIYVTHDQVEAMTLADRIAIMRNGNIMQLGTPDEIYNRPQNRYVADFIGSPSMNFLDGHLERGVFRSGDLSLQLDGYRFGAPQVAARPAILGIRPEHVATGALVSAAPIKGELTAELVEPMGSDTLVWANLAGKPFRIRMDGQARVVPGDRLPIGIDPAKASVFDAKTEERL
jgi:multiple sugar transport system ATP-binding protein